MVNKKSWKERRTPSQIQKRLPEKSAGLKLVMGVWFTLVFARISLNRSPCAEYPKFHTVFEQNVYGLAKKCISVVIQPTR